MAALAITLLKLITGVLSEAEIHVKRPRTYPGVAGGMTGWKALTAGRHGQVSFRQLRPSRSIKALASSGPSLPGS